MRTLVHISDLHFGRTIPLLEQALTRIVRERKPDLVIVSGDLTQRATTSQFQAAKKFLFGLKRPLLIVPGNHDVPLYSVWKRLQSPYTGFRKYIAESLEPIYEDEEMLVVGVNTVRRRKVTEGHINQKQTERLRRLFEKCSPEKMRLIVSHHPFNLPKGHHMRPLSRARRFWKEFETESIDLLLSGHLHDTLERYSGRAFKITRPGPILLQAGTAISDRTRMEKNSFNLLQVSPKEILIERYVANDEQDDFAVERTEKFELKGKQWINTNGQNGKTPRFNFPLA